MKQEKVYNAIKNERKFDEKLPIVEIDRSDHSDNSNVETT